MQQQQGGYRYAWTRASQRTPSIGPDRPGPLRAGGSAQVSRPWLSPSVILTCRAHRLEIGFSRVLVGQLLGCRILYSQRTRRQRWHVSRRPACASCAFSSSGCPPSLGRLVHLEGRDRLRFLLGVRRIGHHGILHNWHAWTRLSQIPCLDRNRSTWATITGTLVNSTSRRASGV
jgi:hypothetical protein